MPGITLPDRLDSNPSDPMTPDPTIMCGLSDDSAPACPSMTIHDDASRISHVKITLSPSRQRQKMNMKTAMNNLAQRRINHASVTDERSQRLADIMPDDEIGVIVLFGGLIVDDHELCAEALRQ